ncbi:MAG TPA: hypothetical protein VF624_00990 [Tepidisphaeraceae bacterium]|jgi:hypothetical protein
MAWKPIKPKQTGPGPFARALISRGAMLVLASVLLFVSYKCFSTVSRANAENTEWREANPDATRAELRRERRLSGAGLPLLIGIGTGGLGAIIVVAALVPSSLFERFNRPPGDPHEQAATVRRFFR